MRTVKTRIGLAEALWPAARRAVLGLLLPDPQKEWHLREIARRTSLSPATVHAEVRSLVAAGILERRVESRRSYYRANTRCPIFPELRQIALKTVGLVDVLRDALADVPNIEVAFIYGSLARGDATTGSDVDLIVVGEVSIQELMGRLHDAQQALAREINPTVYDLAEFRQKMAERHHFLTRVLEGPKFFVVGDADVLERLAELGMGHRT
jgi:predicted nucleotidyltransferase